MFRVELRTFCPPIATWIRVKISGIQMYIYWILEKLVPWSVCGLRRDERSLYRMQCADLCGLVAFARCSDLCGLVAFAWCAARTLHGMRCDDLCGLVAFELSLYRMWCTELTGCDARCAAWSLHSNLDPMLLTEGFWGCWWVGGMGGKTKGFIKTKSLGGRRNGFKSWFH